MFALLTVLIVATPTPSITNEVCEEIRYELYLAADHGILTYHEAEVLSERVCE